MTVSSREKSVFRKKKLHWWHRFLLSSYFCTHPTTLLLKTIGGTDAPQKR